MSSKERLRNSVGVIPPGIRSYFSKWRGSDIPSVGTPRTTLLIAFWSFVGAFLGIAAVTALDRSAYFVDRGWGTMIGSFGASSVLIYGNLESPLSQPINFVGGHTLSAIVGVTVQKFIIWITGATYPDLHEYDSLRWLGGALAVALSVLVMQITRTTHPPGGATALIAATGGPAIYRMGYMYVVTPVMIGSGIMLAVAVTVENIQRRYPVYWVWPARKPSTSQFHHHHHHHYTYNGSGNLSPEEMERQEREVRKQIASDGEHQHQHYQHKWPQVDHEIRRTASPAPYSPGYRSKDPLLAANALRPTSERNIGASSIRQPTSTRSSVSSVSEKVKREELETLSVADVTPGEGFVEWERELASMGRNELSNKGVLYMGSVEEGLARPGQSPDGVDMVAMGRQLSR